MRIKPSEIIVHPNYTGKRPHYYDIALLKLPVHIDFIDFPQFPSKSLYNSNLVNGQVFVLGFGMNGTNTTEVGQVLRMARTLEVVRRQFCWKVLENITEHQFCLHAPPEKNGTVGSSNCCDGKLFA